MISVIMSTYNEPINILKEAVQSILNQTYNDFEFIIVLDNPNRKDILDYLKKCAKLDKRIKLIVNEVNIGLPRSLNRALDVAKGEYIARMDADDIAMEERLYEQYKYIKENNCDLIGSYFQITDENMIKKDICTPPCKDKDIKKLLKYVDCIAHPTFFAKKSIYDKVDGYNNISSCEDYHFLLKIVNCNAKLGNCPMVLLKYRLSKDGISRRNYMRQQLATYFLCTASKSVKEICDEDIDKYINSPEGKRISNNITKFYEIKSKYKNKVMALFYSLIESRNSDFARYKIKGKFMYFFLTR